MGLQQFLERLQQQSMIVRQQDARPTNDRLPVKKVKTLSYVSLFTRIIVDKTADGLKAPSSGIRHGQGNPEIDAGAV